MEHIGISALVGKTIIHIERAQDDQKLKLFTQDKVFEFYHSQDCCEDVSIEDVVGDFEDLINTPILVAEESSSSTNPDQPDSHDDDCTLWTFYKFATVKGWVDVRWLGSSNGYYSMSVSLLQREYSAEDVAAMVKKEHNFLNDGLDSAQEPLSSIKDLKI